MDIHEEMPTLGQRLDGSQPLVVRQRALIDLVDTASDHLRRFLSQRRLPSERQEDITAETWLMVIQKIQGGAFCATQGDPISYVIGIAAMCLKRVPTLLSREAPFADDADFADTNDVFATSDAMLDVARAASSLDDPEDQAVLEAILADRTIREIAAQFGCSYKTAWRRYHRCLIRCRQAFVSSPIEEVSHAATA